MNTQEIREVNDLLRTTMIQTETRRVMLSNDVAHSEHREEIISAVREFKDFEKGDDPYMEHDFGAVNVKGGVYFFKIERFDRNPFNTSEYYHGDKYFVMTIMNRSEY
jgi:hypothetical protein